MKNFIISLTFLFCVTYMHSQNLQFSQVILVTNMQTVPTGKIWKVESYLPTTVKVDSYSPTAFNIVVNSVTYPIGHSAYGNAGGSNALAWSSEMVNTSLPLWLPAGATVAAGSGIGLLSVIEFSAVP
jgi:hypothetical protein